MSIRSFRYLRQLGLSLARRCLHSSFESVVEGGHVRQRLRGVEPEVIIAQVVH